LIALIKVVTVTYSTSELEISLLEAFCKLILSYPYRELLAYVFPEQNISLNPLHWERHLGPPLLGAIFFVVSVPIDTQQQ